MSSSSQPAEGITLPVDAFSCEKGKISTEESSSKHLEENLKVMEMASGCLSNLNEVFGENNEHLTMFRYFLRMIPDVALPETLSKLRTQYACWNLLSIYFDSKCNLVRSGLAKYIGSIKPFLIQKKLSEFFLDTSSSDYSISLKVMYYLLPKISDEELGSFLMEKDFLPASMLISVWISRIEDKKLISMWSEAVSGVK